MEKLLVTKLPIILAHGIARFDVLQHIFLTQLKAAGLSVNDDDLQYFRGIKRFLAEQNFSVFTTDVAFAAGVDTRANQLSGQILDILQTTGESQVHVIAHSMGGLDARHMIVDVPGMADKVASLTTIGTPHNGTVFADRGLNFGGQILIELARPILALDGFKDLTTNACEAFNNRARAAEASNGVTYQTYSSKEERQRVFLPLQVPWQIIRDVEGDNDGLVSIESQSWTSELVNDTKRKSINQQRFPIPADHLNEIGWWDPNEFQGDLSRLSTEAVEIATFEQAIKEVYLQIAKEF